MSDMYANARGELAEIILDFAGLGAHMMDAAL
jgi:hypothetical protein